MQITQLAEELSITIETIRHYESIGLFPSSRQTHCDSQTYTDEDHDRLRFILKANSLGFSQTEIGDILALRDDGQQPCDHVISLIDQKLEQPNIQAEFRQNLLTLRQEATQTKSKTACVCGIIEYTAIPIRN